MRNQRDISGPDAAISRVAANQHGVLALPQLVSAGISKAGVTRRLSKGRLHRVHRGVYAVGHRHISNEGRWMAAVLACGEGAVLSHISAAELWEIRRPRRRLPGDPPAPAHVTVPISSGRRGGTGFMLHRSSTLLARHCTRRLGIPVTTPARTLADLRPLLSPAQLAAVRREAEFLRLPLGEGSSEERARSELEQLFLALCGRHRLPQPVVNAQVGDCEVDFLWRNARLIAEVDGWESHRSRSAFEEDRARDVHLSVLGYRVLRFTWRQVESDPRRVAKTIRVLLRA
jgi:very-short-patch-repair endonuclease